MTEAEAAPEGAAEPLITLVQALPGWGATLLTLAIVALIVLAGLWRPLGRWVAAIPAPLANAMVKVAITVSPAPETSCTLSATDPR